MKTGNITILAVLLASVLIIGGCTTGNTINVPPPQTNTPNPPTTSETPVVVTLVSAPSFVRVGDQITFTWRVDGPTTTIPHTAVHYDYTPHPSVFEGTTPQGSGYPTFTQDYANGQFNIPKTFTASITATKAGTLYYRAHAIVNGEQYWTEEKSVYIANAKTQTTTPTPTPMDYSYTNSGGSGGGGY